MSQTIPLLGHVQRKYKLEEYYGTHKNREIAIMCGVHLRTIHRDIAKWKASGEYDEWLDRRWHYYLESDTVDDRTKFLALTRLKEKRMIRRVEALQKIDMSVKHDISSLLDEYENLFESGRVETPSVQEDDS